MEQQEINQRILEELRKIRIDIDLIKEKMPEEEPLPSIEEQLEMGLEDLRQGKIIDLN